MSAPADWYPDTSNSIPNMMRYWDGKAWTEHTRDAGAEVPTQPAQPVEEVMPVVTFRPVEEVMPVVEVRIVENLTPVVTAPVQATRAKHLAAPERSDDGELKVGLFGAKKVAQQLALEIAELKQINDNLEQVIKKYGIADAVEREYRLSELAAKLAEDAAELQRLKAELARTQRNSRSRNKRGVAVAHRL